ncbi:MAG: acyl-CoA thioesterase, partial [Gemmataceae bacterium]
AASKSRKRERRFFSSVAHASGSCDSEHAKPFRTSRHVEFADTDMAGIVHFANFFRFMEAAEVEFLRQRGLHVSWAVGDSRHGFPRVSATCDYLKPARFEDLLDVVVTVEQVGRKSVTYSHEIYRGAELLARGKITAVFVQVGADRKMESAEIPPEVRAKLEA